MKLTVDHDTCRGHGICVAICPELFALTDAGYATAAEGPVPDGVADAAAQAVAACPEQAIHVNQ